MGHITCVRLDTLPPAAFLPLRVWDGHCLSLWVSARRCAAGGQLCPTSLRSASSACSVVA